MTRTDITFPAGDGTCAAWLYRPGTANPPIIVMAHGLAGVKEQRLDAFADRFTAAGYACLVFDYRHFGASSGEPRQLLDIDTQLADWSAAVGFARTLDGIDPERVIVWGTSFGGGHALITAAQDHRVAAAIVQCPFTDGMASALAMPPLTSVKVTALAARDAIGALLGRAPLMVDTYGPANSTALMTAPDCAPGVKAITPAEVEVRKDVAARFGLQIVRHFPGRQAKNVKCPILFVICENDTVAPAGPTQRYAVEAARSEIRLATAGHFEIYVGEAFETNVADQLAFLANHVPVSV